MGGKLMKLFALLLTLLLSTLITVGMACLLIGGIIWITDGIAITALLWVGFAFFIVGIGLICLITCARAFGVGEDEWGESND